MGPFCSDALLVGRKRLEPGAMVPKTSDSSIAMSSRCHRMREMNRANKSGPKKTASTEIPKKKAGVSAGFPRGREAGIQFASITVMRPSSFG